MLICRTLMTVDPLIAGWNDGIFLNCVMLKVQSAAPWKVRVCPLDKPGKAFKPFTVLSGSVGFLATFFNNKVKEPFVKGFFRDISRKYLVIPLNYNLKTRHGSRRGCNPCCQSKPSRTLRCLPAKIGHLAKVFVESQILYWFSTIVARDWLLFKCLVRLRDFIMKLLVVFQKGILLTTLSLTEVTLKSTLIHCKIKS